MEFVQEWNDHRRMSYIELLSVTLRLASTLAVLKDTVLTSLMLKNTAGLKSAHHRGRHNPRQPLSCGLLAIVG